MTAAYSDTNAVFHAAAQPVPGLSRWRDLRQNVGLVDWKLVLPTAWSWP
jgi:hypothetical protein